VGEMLLGKNPEFFRQKEKPVGFIKPTDGGDGGLRDRNGVSSTAMPLPGMRPVNHIIRNSNYRPRIKLSSQ
jgi:hypothetical protein